MERFAPRLIPGSAILLLWALPALCAAQSLPTRPQSALPGQSPLAPPPVAATPAPVSACPHQCRFERLEQRSRPRRTGPTHPCSRCTPFDCRANSVLLRRPRGANCRRRARCGCRATGR